MAAATTEKSWAETRQIILGRDNYCCVACGTKTTSREADIHHLLPRAMGGTDEASNLVTLCDGCHAAHHPILSAKLARRAIERWAVWLARLFDTKGQVAAEIDHLGPALRLLGVDRFRDGQLSVVQAALNGESVLVVKPTGSGKTLCFQVPALLRPGTTVVISPLKALMAEQVSTLLRKKVPATFMNSDLSSEEKRLRYALLDQGAIKLLHLAPERFFVRSDSERRALAKLRPSYLVIDEAHCVDQWGKDFRPEYGRLGEVRKLLGNPPVLAFTATAGRDMQRRILASLGINDGTVFVADVDRPNISLVRWPTAEKERTERIAQILSLKLPAAKKAMILVPSTKVGMDLQRALKDGGNDLPFYHSRHGTPFDREQLVKRFTNQSEPRIDRMIATSALGMGIDVPGLSLVVHWQHPASLEDYLQEFGRAGRDGSQAVAVVLHDPPGGSSDVNRLRFMAERAASEATQPDPSILRHRHQQIHKMAEAIRIQGCFRRRIVEHFQATAGPHKRLSARILEWAFGGRKATIARGGCCDYCDRSRSSNRLAYVATLVTGGSVAPAN